MIHTGHFIFMIVGQFIKNLAGQNSQNIYGTLVHTFHPNFVFVVC